MPLTSTPWYQRRAARYAFLIILGVITAAASAGAFVFGVLASYRHDQIRDYSLGVTCVILPTLIGVFSEVRAERARRNATEIERETEARLLVTLHSALAPSLYILGQIAIAPNAAAKRELCGRLIQRCVDTAQGLCHPVRARSVFFELRSDRMVFSTYAGRSEPSRTVFTDEPDDPGGRLALQRVRAGEVAIYDDLATDAPPGTNVQAKSYRTFIAVSVRAGDTPFGMLTVDAPKANTFEEEDVETMKTLAGVLGAGLALATRRPS